MSQSERRRHANAGKLVQPQVISTLIENIFQSIPSGACDVPVSKCVAGLCSIQQSDDFDRLWRDLMGGWNVTEIIQHLLYNKIKPNTLNDNLCDWATFPTKPLTMPTRQKSSLFQPATIFYPFHI